MTGEEQSKGHTPWSTEKLEGGSCSNVLIRSQLAPSLKTTWRDMDNVNVDPGKYK